MLKTALVAAALLMLGTSPALARHCPADMAQIDAALAGNPNIPADTLAKVKDLRAQGEALHKAGRHSESEETLAQAKALLGLK